MDNTPNKYLAVAYKLYAISEDQANELIEEATKEHPYQFISEMGITLPAFEANILPLNEGDSFDFQLAPADAYGEYEAERVLELAQEMFCVDGRFNKEEIAVGKYVPMVNADGQRFEGLVLEVKDDIVVMDFNERLAGKTLHFTGTIVTNRLATEEEVQGLINRLAGEGCGCGCDCNCAGDTDSDCGCGGCAQKETK